MIWIQYSLIDGSQLGTLNTKVDDSVLAAVGKGQIEYDGDPSNMMVDITQTPPVVVSALN